MYNATVFKDAHGEVAGVFAAARDISERKQAEKQLLLLTTALESAANGITLTDKNGLILWSNPAFSRMTGYAPDEVIGQNPRFLKSKKQSKEFYRNMWKTIISGEVWRGELINCRKDGTLYYEEQIITPVFDQAGDISNFISIRQDITEHKQAEVALKKSEEQYRSLVDATTQIVWETNAKGEVVRDIPKWRAYTGQDVQEIMGSNWINAVHPEDRQKTKEIWARAVKTKSLYDTEYRIRSRHGEYGYFSVRGVPIKGEDGKIISWIGTCTDITEKKQYENQLIQAEKQALIGRMVGSVTHEINNPLQTIKNCLYLIQQDTGVDSPSREPLEMALSETQRLSTLVGQLRQLYRPQSLQIMQPHDILEILDEVHSLVTPQLIKSGVVWQMLPGVDHFRVNCIRDQMIEVFINLCSNAIEAMQPAGGIITVDMINSVDRTQVGVLISDTGPGINPEILSRMFEPFMTTKGYGMGLGLFLSYGIVQNHGGQIIVDSQVGQGTKFTIWLPIFIGTDEKGE
jgi:nitrogen fixation negative regulator NifL